MEEGKIEEIEQISKINFFKRLWYAIVKIEKYPDMAAEGVKKTLGYLVKIVMILTLVISIGILYQVNDLVQRGKDYLNNGFPEFNYKDGKLNIASEEELKIKQEKFPIGEVIVDTNTDDEQKVNQYINEVIENGEGIIVLKDRVVIKNASIVGTISYSYNEVFEQMGTKEFNKSDVINYLNSTEILKLYISLLLTIFVYSFVMYFLTTISNVFLLSIFGLITTLLARIRMRYVAIFNMSIYAITLSVILNMIYIGINLFIPFTIEYFQVMYVAVSAIYLVAAILIIKDDFIKKQLELMKIEETQNNIKIELKEKSEENETDEDKNDGEENQKKKEKKKDSKKKKDVGKLKDEPEGSEA